MARTTIRRSGGSGRKNPQIREAYILSRKPLRSPNEVRENWDFVVQYGHAWSRPEILNDASKRKGIFLYKLESYSRREKFTLRAIFRIQRVRI